MEIHELGEAKVKIEKAVSRHGFLPEHNYYNYLYYEEEMKKGFFLDFGKGMGIVAFRNKANDTWRLINGILAPEQSRLAIFIEFLEWVLSKKSKKVFVEADEQLKGQIFERLRDNFRLKVNYVLHWPVYDLHNLDEKLSGGRWKKLRNINNRFYKSFKVQILDPRKISTKVLKNILLQWTRKRSPRDRANYGYYSRLIENGFKGLDIVRAVSLNGDVCSFSGGWMIPNSEIFYSSVGVFNYSHKDLGDFVNLDDLLHLKSKGYRYVDFGGSEESLLSFKKKFNPAKIYKTYTFSVAPGKE